MFIPHNPQRHQKRETEEKRGESPSPQHTAQTEKNEREGGGEELGDIGGKREKRRGTSFWAKPSGKKPNEE